MVQTNPRSCCTWLRSHPSNSHMEYIKHPVVAISTFSQMDIAANLVGYVHDNRATAPLETLQFVVSSGKATHNGTLEISAAASCPCWRVTAA
uniref:Uncharacterized protein n=1 Tax=Hucho hucho TaxID=62062 RepID=A0A4W5KXI9_9TELE